MACRIDRIAGLLLGAATMPLVLASPAIAQTEADAAAEEDDGDAIVVSGYRASLQQSRNQKRDADVVVDSVTAEDIGKFSNENVAEALQRVPGVQIDRENGEGRFVSVRGLGPAFNRTTVNGRTAVSIGTNGTTDNRAFNFDSLATEYIAQVSVYKTPTSSMDEGGMGGVVDIRTARPLDARITRRGGTVLALGAEVTYGELVDKAQPRFSVLGATRLAPNLGVLAAVAYSNRALRADQIDLPGYVVQAISGQNVLRPGNVRQSVRTGENERIGGVFAIQWRPGEWDVNLDYLYSRFTEDNGLDMLQQQYSGTISNTVIASDPGRLVKFRATNANVSTFNQISDNATEMHIAGFNVARELGPWRVSADASYAEVAYDAELNSYSATYRRTLDFDLTGAIPTVTPTVPLDPPSNFLQFLGQVNLTRTRETERAGQIDFKRELAGGPLASVQFGAKYRSRETDVVFNVFQYSAANLTTASTQLGVSLVPALRPFPYGDFLPDYPVVSRVWPVIDTPGTFRQLAAVFERILPGGPSTRTPDPSRSFGAGEDIASAYVQLNLKGEALGLPFSGNVGLRYAHTETAANGYVFSASANAYQPLTVDTSYDDWLPSANLKFNLTDSLILRSAAAKVVARSDLVDLSPTTVVQNIASATARSGNPNLQPYRAWQYDLGLEWYPLGKEAYFAVTGFYKDIASFTEFVVSHEQIPGFTSADPDGGFDVTRPSNGSGASLLGVEFSVNLPFTTFLRPGFLDGFGVTGSLTLIDSETNDTDQLSGRQLSITGVAKTNYSLIGYFEKYGLGLRAAYTFRDEFLAVRNSTTNGSAEYTRPYGQFDVSANYDITRNFTVTFQAVNLTRDDTQRYVSVPQLFRTLVVTDRRYVAGIRARF